ncbi:MAG: hypothetical protein EBR82_69015 [Caulobacteraceae bacterium]|nr:hypothetical protein [Caulobacteraceae bacterium]
MPLPFTARSIDPDAAAFCARSGASDRAALSAFVRGVKDLGLWESMVCWPLRSSQNAGTGTTAYSLGGLGTFNGTLTNGPTWGVDGVTLVRASSQRVNLGVGAFGNAGSEQNSVWAFYKPNSLTTPQMVVSQGNGSEAENFAIQLWTNNQEESAVTYAGRSHAAASTTWKGILVGNTATQGAGGFNGANFGTFNTSTTFARGTGQAVIGCWQPDSPSVSNFYDGIVGAVIRINATPTTQLNGNIYTLYKDTLGTGLGLP